MNLKNNLFLLLLISFGFVGCKNKNSTDVETRRTLKTDTWFQLKGELRKLNSLLGKYQEPSQFFEVLSTKITQVNGRKGTVFSVVPQILETESGEPIGKTIRVELIELTSQEQMLSVNAQTVSNGQLLISGGAYYINMTSDGKQLKLKDGKSISVVFPKLSDDEMSLFYGQRDSLGRMNWQETKSKFKSETANVGTQSGQPAARAQQWRIRSNYMSSYQSMIDSAANSRGYVTRKIRPFNILQEDYFFCEKIGVSKILSIGTASSNSKTAMLKIDKAYGNAYEAIRISSLGWINCDRFTNLENKTSIIYKFKPSDNIKTAAVFLVFKNINSVMGSTYWMESKPGFFNIPIGFEVRLIAISVKQNKFYTCERNFTISENQTIDLSMKQTSGKEMNSLFKK